MKLRMQKIGGQAENLPAHDNVMNTGAMGDCVSIVILWNFVGGNAQNVRGYHGFGGLGAINMNSLFAGVPNHNATVVHCIFGSLAQVGSDPINAPAIINARVPLANSHYHNLSNANVTRAGAVSPA
ncbi:MAG TPA: hypothetical protein VIT91_14920 [Chthoniobacterales bacterium]